MAITEDVLVRLRVQGQQQFASAMGGAATQTGRLGTAAGTTGKQVDATGKKAKAAGGKLQGFGKGVGSAVAAIGGLYAAQKVVGDSIRNAVDLGEQINKTAVVFRGPGSKAILDWSKTTSTALGISRREALASAGVLGNMLVPMGIGRTKAADMSRSFVTLASDMASFNNASPEETLDALRSGLAGETEPLRKFGVFLNEARIKQQAMKMGLYDGTGQLDAQAKALATTAIITKDTKDAQGDFARTSDSLANKQRILKAQYEDMTAALGEKLTPIISFLVDNLDALAIGIGVGLVAAFALWTVATWQAVAATTGLAAALQATGIPLIVIAIAALVVGLVIAYKKCETFRNIVDGLAGVLKKVAQVIGVGLKAAFKFLVRIAPTVWEVLKRTPLLMLIRHFGTLSRAAVAAFNWIKNAAKNAVAFVKNRFNDVVNFFRGLPGKIKNATVGMWDGIKESFKSAINAIIGWWNNLELGPVSVPFAPDIPSISTPNIPTLAGGGTALAGRAHLVGEQGPELFVPGQTGTVHPSGGVIHTHVYLNGREIATAVGNAVADRKARR